jgi:hypothetical protein
MSPRTVFDIVGLNLLDKTDNPRALHGPLFFHSFALSNSLGVPWQVVSKASKSMKETYGTLASLVKSHGFDLGFMPQPDFAINVVQRKGEATFDHHTVHTTLRGWMNDLVQFEAQVALDSKILDAKAENTIRASIEQLCAEDILYKGTPVHVMFEEEWANRPFVEKMRAQCIRQGFDNLHNMVDPLYEDKLLV